MSTDASIAYLPWGSWLSGPCSLNGAKGVDLAWLAGLLEGEGCFYTHNPTGPRMEIAMKDYDVLLKAAKFLGNNVRGPYLYKVHRDRGDADIYRITVCASRAIGWMMTLYTHFGKRRQAKIREVIREWRRV